MPNLCCFRHRLLGAAKGTGEKLWRMPLEESYADQLKSPIADMKNLGQRFGGAITAALFCKEFVSTDKVHLARNCPFFGVQC